MQNCQPYGHPFHIIAVKKWKFPGFMTKCFYLEEHINRNFIATLTSADQHLYVKTL